MTDHIMQFFEYAHLPEALRPISKPFCEMAQWIVGEIPSSPERTVALRKLLEAKDAAIRAYIAKPVSGPFAHGGAGGAGTTLGASARTGGGGGGAGPTP